jgi:hypothetical protein
MTMGSYLLRVDVIVCLVLLYLLLSLYLQCLLLLQLLLMISIHFQLHVDIVLRTCTLLFGSTHDQTAVRRATLGVNLSSVQATNHIPWTLSRWVSILTLVVCLVVGICTCRVVV